MELLLSIKPQFAESIFSGEKRFEYRRIIFKNRSVKIAYVYASSPVKRVIGEFRIQGIITAEPAFIWEITKDRAGITKECFNAYFNGRGNAHAIQISGIKKYSKPANLIDLFGIKRPPQSFMYVEEITHIDLLN